VEELREIILAPRAAIPAVDTAMDMLDGESQSVS
jgi:hypothetical protein